jgi:hypothetical protein
VGVRATKTCVTLILTAFACSGGETATRLPAELHGLQLVESRVGDDASELIAGMHEGDSLAPGESEVGFYGTDDMRAVLYVSQFATEEDAHAQFVAMSLGIGGGSSGYGHHTQSEIGGLKVHSVFGRGQIHYFYTSGPDVTWLAAPPAVARPLLAELLEIAVDSIPTLLTPPGQ